MRESLQTTQESWTAYRDQFGILRGELDSVFEKMISGMSEYSETTNSSVYKYLQKFDENLREAMGLLSSAISEMNSGVEELSDALDRS